MDELEQATIKSEKFVSMEKVIQLLDTKVLNNDAMTPYLGADSKFLIQELKDNLSTVEGRFSPFSSTHLTEQ